MTELMPTWQSGTLGAIIQPEGILFGNPAAGLACMSDSAAAAAGKVIDPLFWCMGSWGSTYPVAGDIHMGDRVEARSEEHTSELQSLMRISYAVFCLKKKTT